jgi:hypothetical protein
VAGGGPSAWGLGVGLRTLYRKRNFLRTVDDKTGLGFGIISIESCVLPPGNLLITVQHLFRVA